MLLKTEVYDLLRFLERSSPRQRREKAQEAWEIFKTHRSPDERWDALFILKLIEEHELALIVADKKMAIKEKVVRVEAILPFLHHRKIEAAARRWLQCNKPRIRP